MKIYIAAPLFSHAEQLYNEQIYNVLKVFETRGVTAYLPQKDKSINNKSVSATSVDIAKADYEHVVTSDLIVAILDGQTIDPGVAAEVGIAYAEDIPVIGLYTDSRTQGRDSQDKIDALQSDIAESQFSYLNLFVVGLIKQRGKVVSNSLDLMLAVKEFIEKEF